MTERFDFHKSMMIVGGRNSVIHGFKKKALQDAKARVEARLDCGETQQFQ